MSTEKATLFLVIDTLEIHHPNEEVVSDTGKSSPYEPMQLGSALVHYD